MGTNERPKNPATQRCSEEQKAQVVRLLPQLRRELGLAYQPCHLVPADVMAGSLGRFQSLWAPYTE